jgi:MFS family permease
VGWRWVFIAQAPLVLAGIVVAAAILPETDRAARVRFDVAGAASLAVTVGSAMLAITLGPQRGWSDPAVPALAVVSAVALATFVRVERRAASPLIPPAYWRMRNFVFPTATLALVNVGYMGSFVLMPLMLQTAAFGYTAAQTSRVIIARPLAFALMGPLTGRLAARVGERQLGAFGAVAIVASMLVLTRIEPGAPTWLAALALGIAGLGMGSAAPAMTATVANTVARSDLGVAGAAQQMLQQVGLVIGIQGLQAVQASLEPRGVAGSYQAAFAIGAVVAVVGLVTAMLVHSSGRRHPTGGPAPP